MSKRYLLPCACGIEYPVETAQAGETIRCTCGQDVQVPTLRGLSKLKLADQRLESPQREAPSRASGSRASRPRVSKSAVDWVFLVSLFLCVCGTATVIVAVYLRIPLQPFEIEEMIGERNKDIDVLTIDETLSHWEFLRDNPPGSEMNAHDPAYQVAANVERMHRMAARLERLATVGGIVAVVSFLVLMSCWLRIRARPPL